MRNLPESRSKEVGEVLGRTRERRIARELIDSATHLGFMGLDHLYAIIGRYSSNRGIFLGSAADLEEVSQLATEKEKENRTNNRSLPAEKIDIGIYDKQGRRLMPVVRLPAE